MVSSQFLSKKLTDSLIKSDIIDKKSLDIYTYCFEYIFDIIIFHGSLLVIGLLTNSFIISLFYIFSFTPLRMFAGGAHTNTRLKCSIVSYLCYIIMLLLVTYIPITSQPYYLFFIYVPLIFFILKLAPVFPCNKKSTEKKKKTMHKFCFYDIIILSVFYILLTLEHKYKICECIICSCSFVLIGQLLELRRIRHESENCTM